MTTCCVVLHWSVQRISVRAAYRVYLCGHPIWQKHLEGQLATPSPQARVLMISCLLFETCLVSLSLMLWAKHCYIPVVICSIWCKILYAPTPSHTSRSCITTSDYSNKVELFLHGIPPGLVLESIFSLFFLSFFLWAFTTSPLHILSRANTQVSGQLAGVIWELAVPGTVSSGQREEEYRKATNIINK